MINWTEVATGVGVYFWKVTPSMRLSESLRPFTTDMDGQLRTSPIDVGAGEFLKAPVIAKFIHAKDVGAVTTKLKK